MSVRTLLVLLSALLLVSCGFTDQYKQEYDDLGKQVEAEFKAMPGVAKVDYSYTHGIDQGQDVVLSVRLNAEANPAEMPGKLMEVAQRNLWLGTVPPSGLGMTIRVWSAESGGAQISLEQVDVSDTAEMERKYGPGPKKK